MEVLSKSLKTDVVLESLTVQVENHPDYVVLRCPSIPDYYSGNALILPQAPVNAAQLQEAQTLYRKEFDVEKQGFIRITWDQADPNLDLSHMEAAGFDVFMGQELSATNLKTPPSLDPKIQIRSIVWDQDMEALIDLHTDPHWEGVPMEWQQRFWRKTLPHMKQIQEIFPGNRWVATCDDKIVGDLGIYAIKDIARYHAVMVAPAFRKQGIASNLMHISSEFALQEWGIKELLLVSDKDSVADRLYRALGFKFIENRVEITKMIPRKP